MLQLSKYLGEDVEAWFTGVEEDFALKEKAAVFGTAQQAVLHGIGIAPETIFNIHQVHGAQVVNLSSAVQQSGWAEIPDADGAITVSPEVVLAVRTADCLPVFLYAASRRCIGLVHAGWKSTQAGIVRRAVEMMRSSYGVNPAELKVVFAPAIHRCCYEVGQEFCHIFPEDMVPKYGHWFFDLQGANQRQLEACGVFPEQIYDVGLCTCCQKDFFSYRRQKAAAGRHLSLLRLKL